MKEDLTWLFSKIPKPPVLRSLPLLWPKGKGFVVRVLLDRGEHRYEWEDGGQMTATDLEKVARMVAEAERVAG
jgi:hypothetical protein